MYAKDFYLALILRLAVEALPSLSLLAGYQEGHFGKVPRDENEWIPLPD
ncbi:MAG: hypothetical protein Q8K37_06005 [Alphaproteobacteria bacterium]|nr:hypothetical protein [Alphaproteobacteria bacterium]MDP3531706.1 hypothetical protein [Alphaproteobacteria bacterium]